MRGGKEAQAAGGEGGAVSDGNILQGIRPDPGNGVLIPLPRPDPVGSG